MEASEQVVSVSGEIVFDRSTDFEPTLWRCATLSISLHDTTEHGALSHIVALQRFPFEASFSGQDKQVKKVPFRLEIQSALLRPEREYRLQVHVDRDNDGRISPGDYLSRESYPVLTGGWPTRVTVQLQKVA